MPAFLLPDGQLQLVTGDSFVLGSDKLAQVSVQGTGVAARHLIVQIAGDHWQAATLALNAQSWHNNKPLTGIVRLNDGDVLRLGDASLRWLPGVLAAAPVRQGGGAPAADRERTTPWWLWMLLGSAITALLFGGWVLWERWQGGWQAAAVSTPTPALTVVPTATPGPTLSVNQAPIYRIELNVVIAPAVVETGVVTTTAPTAAATPAVTVSPEISPTLETVVSPEVTVTPLAGASPAASASPPAVPSATPEASAAPATPQPLEPAWVCTPPEGWRLVTVKRTQTVASFARRNGVNLERLRTANCLEGGRVRKGQQVYLPPKR